MTVASRVIGCALLTAALGATLGGILFGSVGYWPAISVLFGCVGAIVGGVAGAAEAIVTSQRGLAEAARRNAQAAPKEAEPLLGEL